MKNITFKTLFLLAFTLFTMHTASAQKTNQNAIIKTVLHGDHCKVCETCGMIFKTEMLKIKGVRTYELGDEDMTFTVFYNEKKTDLQTIKVAISKLGYDADEIKADPEAYKGLDDCCKA